MPVSFFFPNSDQVIEGLQEIFLRLFINYAHILVHELRAENLGLWLTRGEQLKHVTY